MTNCTRGHAISYTNTDNGNDNKNNNDGNNIITEHPFIHRLA